MKWGASGQQIVDARGGSFWFDAGATSLDLAYTGHDDWPVEHDRLRTPAELDAWVQARVSTASPLAPASEADVTAARELRGAILRASWQRAAGARPAPADAACLNELAARPHATPRLDLTADGVVLAWSHGVRAADFLPLLAAEAIEILTAPGDRLRECAADNCPLVFLDTSRAAGRRWCSMQRCGNRRKVRAHRDRLGHELRLADAPRP